MIFDSEDPRLAFALFRLYFSVLLSYVCFCHLTLDLYSKNTFPKFIQLVILWVSLFFSELIRVADNHFLDFFQDKIIFLLYNIEIWGHKCLFFKFLCVLEEFKTFNNFKTSQSLNSFPMDREMGDYPFCMGLY